MLKNIKSAYFRQRHGFLKKFVIFSPLIVLFLNFFLYRFSNTYLMQSIYNYIAVILTPIAVSMISAFLINMEKKKNYHSLFSIEEDKKKIWFSFVITAVILFMTYILAFFVFPAVSVILLGVKTNLWLHFAASILIFLTYMWQIPLWMYLAEKIGSIPVVVISTIVNFFLSIKYAAKSLWFIPFALPARMCLSVLGILPNGLLTDDVSLLDKSVILPGVLISLVLFIFLSIVTSYIFTKREV